MASRRHHHHVYDVELSDRVWSEPAFRKANPEYRLGLRCGIGPLGVARAHSACRFG